MENNDVMRTTIHKGYRFRMLPLPDQEDMLRQNCGAARYVYNKFVDMGNADMASGRKIKRRSYAELFAEAPWLKQMDSCALDSAKRDYYKALERFFEVPHTGKPKRKKKRTARKSYRTNNQKNAQTIWLKKNKLKLPKIKRPIKIVKHRYLPDGCRITSATIVEETRGEWYVSLLVEYDIEIPRQVIVPMERLRGLDYSSPLFYVDDKGASPNMTRQYRVNEDRIAFLQSKQDKKEYTSGNWWEAHDKVSKEHSSVARKRRDFIEQESARMADANDIVFVEDLDLRALARSLKLGKSTNDNGFGMFRTRLSDKLSERGGAFVKLPRFFPSSKTCSTCGHKYDELALGEREWDCTECGTHHLRDANAARNLLSCGLFGLAYDGYITNVVTDDGEIVALNAVCENDIELLRVLRTCELPGKARMSAVIFNAELAYLVDEDELALSSVMISDEAVEAWCAALLSLSH